MDSRLHPGWFLVLWAVVFLLLNTWYAGLHALLARQRLTAALALAYALPVTVMVWALRSARRGE